MANRACPKCREIGHDRMGDHLFQMKDGITWACFKPYHAPYVERDSVEQDRPSIETIEMVENYPVVNFDFRGIPSSVYETFDIRFSVDEERGQPEFLFYPIWNIDGASIIGYHRRSIKEKAFKNIGNIGGIQKQLFGQNKCAQSGKMLIICEGHQDMLAAYHMLLTKYPNFIPNVVSTNNGTGDILTIAKNVKFLKGYQKVILCKDNDEPGEKFAREVSKLIGTSLLVTSFSEKDANDMLLKGRLSEFISSIFNASHYLPTDIILPSQIREQVKEEIIIERTYPFNNLNRYAFGIFKRTLITIGAGVGTGKSVFVDTIVKHLIFNYDAKVAMFSLEEHPSYTMKKIVGGIIGVPLHIPGIKIDGELQAKIDSVIDSFGDRLLLYDCQGFRDIEDIENTIRYLSSIGVEYFFLDPLTAVTAELSATEANERLNSFCAMLGGLVIALNICVFLVTHLNNPKVGKAHSEGGRVSGEQATSSRAPYRWSHLFLGLERDQQAEDEDEKNTLYVRIIKNRIVGKTGVIKLKYDSDTNNLYEPVEESSEVF